MIPGCSCHMISHVLRIQGCFASLVVTQMCNSAFSAHRRGSKNKVIIKSLSTKSSPMLRIDKNGTVIGGEVGGIPNSWIYDNPMNNLYNIYVKKGDLERAKEVCDLP